MTTIRKYYAMVPSIFSFEGNPYWLELLRVKSLTSTQSYVDMNFGGLADAEIAVSINGGEKKVVTRKVKGKWELIYK